MVTDHTFAHTTNAGDAGGGRAVHAAVDAGCAPRWR